MLSFRRKINCQIRLHKHVRTTWKRVCFQALQVQRNQTTRPQPYLLYKLWKKKNMNSVPAKRETETHSDIARDWHCSLILKLSLSNLPDSFISPPFIYLSLCQLASQLIAVESLLFVWSSITIPSNQSGLD